MLFYLFSDGEVESLFERLNYDLEPGTILRTIEYYLPRTSHGSTLSKVVHSWVLASDREGSWTLFEDALRSDLDDTQGGTTAEGVHLGAMAATVDLMHRCYLGIETRDDVIWFDPVLPTELRRLALDIHYRGHTLIVTVAEEVFTVEVAPGSYGSARLGLGGQVIELLPGDRHQIGL